MIDLDLDFVLRGVALFGLFVAVLFAFVRFLNENS